MENQDQILVPGNMTIFSFAIALWQSSPKSLPKDSQEILEMVPKIKQALRFFQPKYDINKIQQKNFQESFCEKESI